MIRPTRTLLRRAPQILLLCMLIGIPARPTHALEDAAQEIVRGRIERLRQFGELRIGDARIAAVNLLPQFYERRDFKLAWTNREAIADLERAVEESRLEGLDPEDYLLSHLRRLRASAEAGDELRTVADLDLLLTDAFMRLGYHLVFGKVDPERLDSDWNLARDIRSRDPVSVIGEAIEAGAPRAFLESLKPDHAYYAALKKGLAEYRALEDAGGWPSVTRGPTLKPGATGPRVEELRRRLMADGQSVKGDVSTDLFDATLESAVRRFQTRHGLASDGIVGAKTIAAFNVTVSERVDQIRLNLERARWVLHDVPDEFVIVNIADFRAFYVVAGKRTWESRVQVGKSFRKTPVFKGDIKYVVVNPTWTVPPTVLVKDILPRVKRDPSYLATKNISVIDHNGAVIDAATLDWSQYPGKTFPYMLRQRPGPLNALGLIKFIFPNKHFVFMHDTPSKALFERDVRTFSSGCVRLDRPFELASMILSDKPEGTADALKQILASRETKTIYLTQPLPVILLYWTVAPAEDGTIRFIDDVYGRDPAVLRGLSGAVKRRARDLIEDE